MKLAHLRGKYLQLSELPWSRHGQFIRGWLARKHTGIVPCALPKSKQLLFIPLSDFYESYAYFSESKYGRDELEFFVERVRPGDVIYDIGAFRGVYGAAAKAALGDLVAIHLFEPIQQNVQRIETISQLNGFRRFEVVERAVGLDQILTGGFDQKARMLRQGDASDTLSPMNVPSISLDSYVNQSGAAPSLIKLDVEGFEYEVLEGGQESIQQNKPRVWLELHPEFLQAKGRNWQEPINLLKSFGYQIIRFYSDFKLPTRDAAFHVWCES
jgi:FkbM family methyltransferase